MVGKNYFSRLICEACGFSQSVLQENQYFWIFVYNIFFCFGFLRIRKKGQSNLALLFIRELVNSDIWGFGAIISNVDLTEPRSALIYKLVCQALDQLYDKLSSWGTLRNWAREEHSHAAYKFIQKLYEFSQFLIDFDNRSLN